MSYTWDRLDYTTKEICDAGCGKALTRGLAYIVIDGYGNEHHCGVVCAEKLVGEAKPRDLPNITLNDSSEDGKGSSESGLEVEGQNKSSIKKEALEYLLLRYHFNDCRKIYHENVQVWYDKKSSLEDDDYKHIVNTKNKLKGNRVLSSLFLKKVLKLEFELKNKAKKTPASASFMSSMVDDIHKYMALTDGQKKGVLKWFEKGIDLSFLPTRVIKKP